MPRPLSWKKEEQKPSNPTTELICGMTEEQLKDMVLSGTVETAIADSGATSSCGKKAMSKCGTYALDTSALVATDCAPTKYSDMRRAT